MLCCSRGSRGGKDAVLGSAYGRIYGFEGLRYYWLIRSEVERDLSLAVFV